MVSQGEYIQQDKENYLPVFNRYKIVLSHGDGPYVYDVNGKKYLDFLAGIAVNILGHNHEELIKSIELQAKKIIHCSNLYCTPQQVDASIKLKKLAQMDKVFFANSGTEANEGAIKLARKYGCKIDSNKYEIISAVHSFHGRTLASLTATGQDKYHKGIGPLPVGFKYVPYNDLSALEQVISNNTAAVILEAIQGEGGVNIPKLDYLVKVKKLCEKYDALLIMDEIQCGIGRTGTFNGYDNFGVKPDIVTYAKGLAGGVPIGAIATTNKVANAFVYGDHGTTFGGNPLACAAASTVLDVLVKENLMDNAKAMGKYFQAKLNILKEKYPNLIKDVRGFGLLIGMELNISGADIVNQCLDKGLIINCTAGNVLRFVPPLNINEKHIDELLNILEPILAEFA